MKGRKPTCEEQKYMNLVGELGCIICLHYLKIPDCPCSPHHVNGRTKPDVHFEVFGLCGTHHQTGKAGVALHVNKYMFEQNFDTEENLIILQREKLSVEVVNGKVILI